MIKKQFYHLIFTTLFRKFLNRLKVIDYVKRVRGSTNDYLILR